MAVVRTKSFGEKVRDLFNRAEKEGMNYNTQMGHIANLCADFNIDPQIACDHMHIASLSVLRRRPKALEIENWIKWAYEKKQTSVNGLSSRKPKSQARRNDDIISEWASKGSLKNLMNRSKPIPPKPEPILETLYDDDELLHISPDIYHDTIKPRNQWVKDGLDGMQYFCPCIFKGDQKGRLAENVAKRKYVVFETDDLPAQWDEQCGLIDRLSKELDLVMVVNSSSKSLHATFDADVDETKLQKFMDLVITLGGDRAVLRPSQMVRFPWGKNTKTGKTQEVIYYGR